MKIIVAGKGSRITVWKNGNVVVEETGKGNNLNWERDSF